MRRSPLLPVALLCGLPLGGCGAPDPADDSADAAADTAAPVVLPEPVLYVMERYEGTLFALDRSQGTEAWRLDGLPAVVGVAVAADGWIYAAATDDDFVGSLHRVSPDGAQTEQLIPPDGTLLRPQGLWYDAATDTLLLCDVNADTVYEIELVDFGLQALATVPEPSDVTRRPGEAIAWVTARGEGRLYAVEGGVATPLGEAGTLPDAHELLPGPDGSLYVVSTGARALLQLDPATGATERLAERFGGAPEVGLCFDAVRGSLGLTDHGGGTAWLYDVATRAVAPYFHHDRDLYGCANNQPPDADGDGAISWAHGGPDCDDADAEVRTAAACGA